MVKGFPLIIQNLLSSDLIRKTILFPLNKSTILNPYNKRVSEA